MRPEHPADGKIPPSPRLRGALEVAALILLAGIALIVLAVAVQGCVG